MLIRLSIANHRSILAPVTLSMVAVDNDRPAAREVEGLSERLLTTAAVLGPNASGKSAVLDGLRWLSEAIRTSLRGWEEGVPRDPHRFGEGRVRPTSFDLDLAVNGVRYSYALEVDDERVLYESLSSFPHRRRRLVFEREGDQITFRRDLGAQAGIRELLTPTTLVVSAGRRLGVDEIFQFGRAISVDALGAAFPYRPRIGKTMRDETTWLFRGSAESVAEMSGSSPQDVVRDRSKIADLLAFADLGIEGVEPIPDGRKETVRRQGVPRLLHRAGDEAIAFEPEQESRGTRAWFELLGPVIAALRDGSVLLVDEIDASLHPTLTARLLELFQSPHSNPRGAQLIFSTHDTSLLRTLNRDEVWLTEKDARGATSLTALAEFGGDQVRRSTNLERGYLQGRFGAVPELDEVALLHALESLP